MSHYSLLAALAAVLAGANEFTPYIYFENQEFLANKSNAARISWPDVEAAFQHPSTSDVSSYGGFDWTKPYPGSPIEGFQAHLRIAHDVPWPESVAKYRSTEVTALTFSVPEALMNTAKGVPKAIDPSWYICRHYFVSKRPDPTAQVDHDCGFLSAECRADFEDSLTKGWFKEDPDVPCSALTFDPVPVSCQDTLGLIRGDVIAWSSEAFEDEYTAKVLAVDQITDSSWLIGTGAVAKGDMDAYYEASNRTFIVGTVFGYSAVVDKANRKTPRLSLACLRPQWEAPPKSSVSTTVTPYVYPQQSTTAAVFTTTSAPTTVQSESPTTTEVAGSVGVSNTATPSKSNGDLQRAVPLSLSVWVLSAIGVVVPQIF
ncbi:uncharacterized protein CTRU02_207893 [Colletotrichum truncatum]|uniref:Uncharacterized protein n=1 Tax=Colletotrichum truncatum TaxID=5467 RepID=A0ACC3Z256_COLTU|nr:uncharacterized protein CTRU02_14884 [Colletotrichum truncatum]KAF6781685.1 hypothetical protein CTRU02_14884 [Colletotrichum truncatum]